MKQPKPYIWKEPRAPAFPRRLDRPEGRPDPEMLVGVIQNLPASDLEERFARALDKVALDYEFRAPFIAGRNLPGEIEVDFVIYQGAPQPIQVDGAFAHKSAERREEDRAKDAILNEHLKGYALPVIRVSGDDLQTQDDADFKVTEIF